MGDEPGGNETLHVCNWDAEELGDVLAGEKRSSPTAGDPATPACIRRPRLDRPRLSRATTGVEGNFPFTTVCLVALLRLHRVQIHVACISSGLGRVAALAMRVRPDEQIGSMRPAESHVE